jgi:hypothetical protein
MLKAVFFYPIGVGFYSLLIAPLKSRWPRGWRPPLDMLVGALGIAVAALVF